MPLFDSPTSFRLRELATNTLHLYRRSTDQEPLISPSSSTNATTMNLLADTTLELLKKGQQAHGSHPSFLHLAGLVCEAVLEVVFVALPGFIVAYTGMFDAKSQKFVAELNTMVFTPCLVFTKLASQLNADKLADLVVIPFIFAAQTLVSWCCAQVMARAFGFSGWNKRREKNFILAMGVFGNSNSLPISLVLSLSKTISGLHWDKIPGDNDNEVAARGILYLLIFQQLGQLLRWTWGYSVLLKPASAYEAEDRERESEEERWREEGRYRDEPDEPLPNGNAANGKKISPDSGFNSGNVSDARSSGSEDEGGRDREHSVPEIVPSTAANGKSIANEPRHLADQDTPTSPSARRSLGDRARSLGHITTFPNYSPSSNSKPSDQEPYTGWTAPFLHARDALAHQLRLLGHRISSTGHYLFVKLPLPLRRVLVAITNTLAFVFRGIWRQMNPPLWAMLIALIVASIPQLQHLFFTPGTLINNSLTRAVSQSGGVAVPLILVVLGANLARSTLPQDQLASTASEKADERKLLYASLLSRMVLPTIIMAPLLALMAKFLPISILDDPIFIIVCFLLTGAPSALQLAQICQVNGVFMGTMSNLLTASYVVAILPSTLVLVMLGLEVLEWAQGTGVGGG
ncbi:auxin efflux carrier [Hortaea werneckii]|nr:auxin efflux carrier [Hortaea werneckii]